MNNTASHASNSVRHSRVIDAVSRFLDYPAAVANVLERWRRRQQTSMQFAHLDPRILRDAGISEAQRFIEVNKPFGRK